MNRGKSQLAVTVIISLLMLNACINTGAKFTPQADPLKGQALVYIYRNKQSTGLGVSWPVTINDETVNHLRHGEYSYHYLNANQYIHVSAGKAFGSDKPQIKEILLNSGDVLYLKLDMQMISHDKCHQPPCSNLQQNLELIESTEALAELANYRFSQPD